MTCAQLALLDGAVACAVSPSHKVTALIQSVLLCPGVLLTSAFCEASKFLSVEFGLIFLLVKSYQTALHTVIKVYSGSTIK